MELAYCIALLARANSGTPFGSKPLKPVMVVSVIRIPAEFMPAVEAAREKLTDLVVEADETLMEKFLEGETLSQEDLEKLLGLAIAQGVFIPVFVGSAAKLQGVEDLLDEVVTFLPEPTAHGPMPTVDGGEVPFNVEGADSAFVFKTMSDPYLGRLNFVKVV